MSSDLPQPHRSAWLTPRDGARQGGEYRRRSRREVAREELLGEWYGDEVAPLEIESRQAPAQGVGPLIDQVLQDLDQGDKVLLRRLLAAWPELVGAEICRVTSPQSIRGKTLYVEVADATWRFRLQSVIADLNQRVAKFSAQQVTSVRLSPGGRTAARG